MKPSKSIPNYYVRVFTAFLMFQSHLFADVGKSSTLHRCKDSTFCELLRTSSLYKQYKPDKDWLMENGYEILTVDGSSTYGIINGTIIRRRFPQQQFEYKIRFLPDSTLRFSMSEKMFARRRFEPKVALAEEPELRGFAERERLTKNYVRFETIPDKEYTLLVYYMPAKLELFHNSDNVTPAVVVNANGKLQMDHYSGRIEIINDPVYWKISLDVSFPKSKHLYGLSQHYETLTLQSTNEREPYHLYNVEAPYASEPTNAMYGSVPMVLAHSRNGSAGVFWYNSAETWVDIEKQSPTVNFTNVQFMSETGAVDLFIMMGPTFSQVIQQFARLTGKAPLPPYFSLGFHQSSSLYDNEDDIRESNDEFELNRIPVAAFWLSAEPDYRYNIWNEDKFQDPLNLMKMLEKSSRKLVVAVRPYVGNPIDLYDRTNNDVLNYFVRSSDGIIFQTKSLQGRDYGTEIWYSDFLHPHFQYCFPWRFPCDNRGNFTTGVNYIWNDLNQPFVKDEPGSVLPKNALHFNGWEDRDIHNAYSLLQANSTYAELLRQGEDMERPFILSTSYFAGSQRYVAITTGKHLGSWEYLRRSISMCLTAAISGISFCGVDVGVPAKLFDFELLVRWYQLSAFLPFFRAHTTTEAVMQNFPYLFPYSNVGYVIIDTLRHRLSLLPYWYTVFYEHTITGNPVIRPLVYEFPDDEDTFDIDYEYFIGDALLVRPVTEERNENRSVPIPIYFPDFKNWYDYKRISASPSQIGNMTIGLQYPDLEEIPVYVKGGTILPRCTDVFGKYFTSAEEVRQCNISLFVAPDRAGKAVGHLYLDDGRSFEYKKGKYVYLEFEYDERGMLSMSIINWNTSTPYRPRETIKDILVASRSPSFLAESVRNVRVGKTEIPFESRTIYWMIQPKGYQLPLYEKWTIEWSYEKP